MNAYKKASCKSISSALFAVVITAKLPEARRSADRHRPIEPTPHTPIYSPS
ncbi:MAG: hypothetical protein IJU78_04160 [Clostridia bacterium]|nr:hypothetical protein [Clostridia bacterium]